MRIFSLFFLIGTVFIQLFASLPSASALIVIAASGFILILLLFLLARKHPKLKKLLPVFFALLSGFLLATLTAETQLNNTLAKKLEGKDIILQGKIKDIPDDRQDGVRFRFKIEQAFLAETSEKINLSGVVRLGWFQAVKEIHADQYWQLKVRLKRPSGFINPGGFDYEKWLFSQRIVATGYVRKWQGNHRLQSPQKWLNSYSVNSLRETINRKIQQQVKDKASAAVLSALTVALRNRLDETQWQLLQKTGTSHLIAISGLHIAVIAGFAFFPVMLIWRIFPRLNEKIPLQIAAGIASVLLATAYALLAGFSLPTQRALLMVIVVMIGVASRKNYNNSAILATALMLVLLFDPLAAMSISFWLSFSAVALILLILKRQISKPRFHVLTLQLVLSLGMLPLTLLFFSQGSLSAPLANLVAIPWVSVLVVPVSLLAVIFLAVSDYISSALFDVSSTAIHFLFEYLELLGKLPFSTVMSASLPFSYLLLAISGIMVIILPKGFPARWLGFILLLPAFLYTGEKLQQDDFSFSLLDVGQGSAAVIHTANHTLVYDTGTRLSPNFDIGKLVVIPYLRFKGVKKVDMLILSHNNLDHRGGAKAIINQYGIKNILSSDTQILDETSVTACVAGQKWQWDGVTFEMLWPDPDSDTHLNKNNRSCVLRVSNALHSLLLTGDIQRKAETLLSQKYQDKIKSEVIMVPHHGSKTSSSDIFLDTVSPALAVVSAGYRNRFGHPGEKIIKRYATHAIQILDTIHAGEIEIFFSGKQNSLKTNRYRIAQRRFWNR